MQLPRGRFHRLLKSTTPRALVEDAETTRFTGICTIALGRQNVVLVINEGEVLLAEYGGMKGRYALDEVLKSGDSEVAAELNLLTLEQVNLALEFNQSFAIASGGSQEKVPPSRQGESSKGADGVSRGKRAEPVPLPKARTLPAAPGARGIMPRAKPEPAVADPALSDHEDIDALIQSMESMDVEQLVSSFRVNCKDVLKRIHLDHLIQDGDA
jgi:hypothetical protein